MFGGGSRFIISSLSLGDLVRIYFQSSCEVLEGELVRLSLIPKSGSSTLTKIVIPEVLSDLFVHVYP